MSEHPFIRDDVERWLYDLAVQDCDPILDEMHNLARERGFPIVGPEVGRLLAQLARAFGARRIFEMGSGFGYSTLWFARAAAEGAEIVHTEGDAANSELARDFLTRAGVVDRVSFHVGDALELIEEHDGEWDIIFCDVDKEQYPEAYERFRRRVRVGGLVVVDNLVWSGRVAAGEDDEATCGVREYLRRMWGDPCFLSSLLPVRDGVGLSLRVR